MNSLLARLWMFISTGLILIAIIMQIVAPEYMYFSAACLVIGIIIKSIFIFVNREYLKKWIRTSFFKKLGTNLLRVLLVFSIIGVINYLVFKNDKAFDLTGANYHSLSSQSLKIVRDLNSDLEIILFSKRGNWEHYLSILNKYEYASSKIKLKAFDIDKELALVRYYGVKENGSVILKYKGKKVLFKISSELNITNNIIKVTRESEINIYYTQGHGELDFTSKKKLGASVFSNYLSSSNYIMSQLDTVKDVVPKNADAILITAPRYGFLDQEVEKLRNYLKRGGNLIILLQANLLRTNFENIYKLLEENGVEVIDSIVIDRLAKTQGSEFSTPIINQLDPKHPITKDFRSRLLFPLTLGFSLKESNLFRSTALGWSTAFPATWGESSIEQVIKGRAAFDDNDTKGPITVAVATENLKDNSRIIAIGGGTMISNAFESQSGNFNFILNSISWALNDNGLISLDRAGLKNNKVMISFSQESLILFFLLICIPSLFFILGFYFYRRALSL